MEAEAALAPRTRDRIRPEGGGGTGGERRLEHLQSEYAARVSRGNYNDCCLDFSARKLCNNIQAGPFPNLG